jgi:2-methylcitrate dehydratase PrpD
VQAAQMSLPHNVALAAAIAASAEKGFALTVADYERSLDDPRVKEIEARVRCEVDPEVEAATTAQAVPARVTVTLKDASVHSTFVAAPLGSPSRPFAHDDHVARFRRELTRRWDDKTCDQVIASAENLVELPIDRITDLIAAAS